MHEVWNLVQLVLQAMRLWLCGRPQCQALKYRGALSETYICLSFYPCMCWITTITISIRKFFIQNINLCLSSCWNFDSCCMWECCACVMRRGHISVAPDCMLSDWSCACVFACMLRHKEAPNILQLQKKLEVLPVQILYIESFLFVAWPGIPLQKPCVLWVHCWLLMVFCASCL